jgi:hypothetical protein
VLHSAEYHGALRKWLSGMLYEDYCYMCGSYTAIDRQTKLCGPCYDRWCASRRVPSAA